MYFRKVRFINFGEAILFYLIYGTRISSILMSVSLETKIYFYLYTVCIFSSSFVRGYENEEVNDLEVINSISIHERHVLFVLTVSFEGATMWAWE